MIEPTKGQVHLMATTRMLSLPGLHLGQLGGGVIVALRIEREQPVIPLLAKRSLDESASLARSSGGEIGLGHRHGDPWLMEVFAREQTNGALYGLRISTS